MLTLTKVHDYQKVEGSSNEVKLVGENPYIRLSQDHKALFIQNGEVYSGVGSPALEYKEIPEWFWKLARGCNKEGRDRVGLILPEEMTDEALDEAEVPEKTYECPETDCLKSMPLSHKGVHMGGHAKKKKAAKKKLEKVVKVEMKKEGTILEESVKAAAEQGIVYEVEN